MMVSPLVKRLESAARSRYAQSPIVHHLAHRPTVMRMQLHFGAHWKRSFRRSRLLRADVIVRLLRDDFMGELSRRWLKVSLWHQGRPRQHCRFRPQHATASGIFFFVSHEPPPTAKLSSGKTFGAKIGSACGCSFPIWGIINPASAIACRFGNA